MPIFVAHLFWETTAGALAQLFAPNGPVDRVQMIRGRPPGRARGLGLVEMPNRAWR